MVQLSERFVPIKLNAEKAGRATATKYGVNGFPTILFLTGDGKQVSKIGGYMPPESFSEEMKKALDVHTELPKLQRQYQNSPNNLALAARLAALLAASGDGEGAAKTLDSAEALDPRNAKDLLTKVYNAVGDHFQLDRKFDRAVPYFTKAADTGKSPKDVSYALVSIAACHMSSGKFTEAIPFCEKTLALAGAPDDMKQAARQMLEYAKKQK